MTEKMKLSEYKRQIYLFFSEDGLADLAVGLMIFGFGILLSADLPAFVGLLGIIPFLVWYLGKQSLVIPRIGTIQPGGDIKQRFLGYFINLLVLGTGVLVLYLINLGKGMDFFSAYSMVLFGFVLALAISSLGLMLKASRFYFYGLLVLSAISIGDLLGRSITVVDPFLIAVITAGGLILIVGAFVLARFLNKYPVLEMEE